jgi:hypothetical protein
MSKRKHSHDTLSLNIKNIKKQKKEDDIIVKVEYFNEPIPNYVCEYVNGIKHGLESRYTYVKEPTSMIGSVKYLERCNWSFGEKHGKEIKIYDNTWKTNSHTCNWINGKKHGEEIIYLPNKDDDLKEVINLRAMQTRFKYKCYWKNGVKHNDTMTPGFEPYNTITDLVTNFKYHSMYKNGELVKEDITDKSGNNIFNSIKEDGIIKFSCKSKWVNNKMCHDMKSNIDTIKKVRKIFNIVSIDDFTLEQICDPKFNIVKKISL